MLSRSALIAKGRGGPNQRFSTSRDRSTSAANRIAGVYRPGVEQLVRDTTLANTTLLNQFAVLHDGDVVFVARPALVTRADGVLVVHGSMGDGIGQYHPIEILASEFRGYFSTLLQSRQVGSLGLEDHPIAPETIPPPPVGPRRRNAGEQYQPELARLEFEMPADPDAVVAADRPRITCLPKACGLEPGVTLDTPLRLSLTTRSTVEDAPLLQAWLDGVRYVSAKNNGFSITEGGPKFDPQGFDLDDDEDADPDPFSSYTICERAGMTITFLNPSSPEGLTIKERMDGYSEEVWIDLATRMVNARDDNASDDEDSVVVAGGAERSSEEKLADAIIQAKNKGKVFKGAKRVIAQHRVFLACPPVAGSDVVVLPELSKSFIEALKEEKGVEANNLLQAMYRAPLKVMKNSPIAMLRDITFHIDQITLALSDAHRLFNYVDEPLADLTLEKAEKTLNLMHWWTPQLLALLKNAANDEGVKLITRANVNDAKAALEAVKKSKLFCGGTISNGREAYEMLANFNGYHTQLIEKGPKPLVVQCLEEFATALTSEKGKRFLKRHEGNTDIALHIYNDTQHVVSEFISVAKDPKVYGGVEKGQDVAFSNMSGPLAVHRASLLDLTNAISGSGLSKYKDSPDIAHWFSRPTPARERSARTPPTPPTRSPGKRAKTNDDGVARIRGGGGLLTYNPPDGKSDRLPIKDFDVFGKSRDGKSERVCMQFLVQGHSCKRGRDCKFLHVTRLDQLAQAEQDKFKERVQSIDGLEWAPGSAPPGMN